MMSRAEDVTGDVPTEEEMRAADGRVPGRRGRATRQKLLECTAEMLDQTSFRDVKVVDIAREAGTSPATFYQYFPDVESAILVLAEDMTIEGGALVDLVRENSWKGKAGYESAQALVDGLMEFWQVHRSLLQVVDLATKEGDERFHQIRTKLLNGLTEALKEVIEDFQRAGKHPLDEDPMATAGVLVSMLANTAAHRYGFEFWGIRTNDVKTSMARIIFWSITNQKPPADG
jgi:AcrR family transcriptional regulator